MFLQLPNGKTISISTEYYFSIPDDKLSEFFQDCIASDIGLEINYPFISLPNSGEFPTDDIPEQE